MEPFGIWGIPTPTPGEESIVVLQASFRRLYEAYYSQRRGWAQEACERETEVAFGILIHLKSTRYHKISSHPNAYIYRLNMQLHNTTYG